MSEDEIEQNTECEANLRLCKKWRIFRQKWHKLLPYIIVMQFLTGSFFMKTYWYITDVIKGNKTICSQPIKIKDCTIIQQKLKKQCVYIYIYIYIYICMYIYIYIYIYIHYTWKMSFLFPNVIWQLGMTLIHFWDLLLNIYCHFIEYFFVFGEMRKSYFGNMIVLNWKQDIYAANNEKAYHF